MLLFQGIVEPCDRIVVDQAAGIDHAVVAVGRFDAALVGLVCLDGRAALISNKTLSGACAPALPKGLTERVNK